MTYTLLRRAAIVMMATAAGPALAAVVTFSGALGDATNTALVASDLGTAQFSDDLAKANNVALYALHVSVDGMVGFTSSGYAAGGTDPYFTLFRGLNSATATFVASNYFHALAWGGDFTQTEILSAGDYTVAIGTFVNLSFAENLGSGVLADGFIGLGDPRFFGEGAYTLTVTLPDTQTVPEPAGTSLTFTAALAALWASRHRKSATPNEGR
ncbi:MAG: DVUA0089 family protein [Rubrivivax sp.]|nr:DVUA0089 family protein [Rubrivivax sp.]